jgi:hypothetical protein
MVPFNNVTFHVAGIRGGFAGCRTSVAHQSAGSVSAKQRPRPVCCAAATYASPAFSCFYLPSPCNPPCEHDNASPGGGFSALLHQQELIARAQSTNDVMVRCPLAEPQGAFRMP